jgi:hypothetical protein
MEIIIAVFEPEVVGNQQEGCYAYRQSENVDGGEYFVLPQIAPGGYKIIA